MPTIDPVLGPDPDGGTNIQPLPTFTSSVRQHAPQADVSGHHTTRLLKGWLPHAHIIFEDLPFDEKQKLGGHMELFHAPED